MPPLSSPSFLDEFDALRAEVEVLRHQDPAGASDRWVALRTRVDDLCTALTLPGKGTAAHAALPDLSDLITQVEQVIAKLAEDQDDKR